MGEVFAAVVYVLCFLTSGACAWLLGRSYRANGAPLLFWSSVCFAFLAANNLVLMIDLVVFPQMFDLRIVRLSLTLAAVVSLVWGFIWRAEED